MVEVVKERKRWFSRKDRPPRPKKPGSLKTSFALYLALCVLAAAALSALTLLVTIWLYRELPNPLDHMAEMIGILLVPVWCVLCVVQASRLFYRHKLRRPLVLLDTAAANIAESNLDFAVSCPVNNELGRLCTSFETMRRALADNNRELWRQMEERRRLAAAFSHDLRTPLTVLRGEVELLRRYVPDGTMDADKVLQTAGVMAAHIERLERYVETMTRLQRLEDTVVERREIAAAEMVARLSYCAGMLSGEKEIAVDASGLTAGTLSLDPDLVMRVFENLVGNALRHAESRVEVTLYGSGALVLTVQDDGPGFPPDALERVLDPFWRADGQGEEDGHMGLGLSICKILCEKHGGGIVLENQNGARVSVCFPSGHSVAKELKKA